MQCCKKLRPLVTEKREEEEEAEVGQSFCPWGDKLLMPQGHFCSSTPDTSGLCTLWSPKGSSQLSSLGSDMGSGVTALLLSHILLH